MARGVQLAGMFPLSDWLLSVIATLGIQFNNILRTFIKIDVYHETIGYIIKLYKEIIRSIRFIMMIIP